jgi:hypothetical protein
VSETQEKWKKSIIFLESALIASFRQGASAISHHQSGSAHLAGDGRFRLVVPYFIYQIIEQHLRFQGTLQTARFDFIDYKTYLIVEIVQNLS